jgi:hypothetical protein
VALEAIANEIPGKTELIPGSQIDMQIVVDAAAEISLHRRCNMHLASAPSTSYGLKSLQ